MNVLLGISPRALSACFTMCAKLIQTHKILIRKLPVIGIKDWLLIYDDTLLELAVKDAYDELEIVVI